MRTSPSVLDSQTGQKPEEGKVAKAIEHKTQRIPSDIFLWTALGFFGLSVAMQTANRKHSSLLLSQLAPTFLLLGIYNKLVKVAGSDSYEAARNPAFSR
jgi:hypothetical protein